jgi:hypothetical protein
MVGRVKAPGGVFFMSFSFVENQAVKATDDSAYDDGGSD